MKAFERVTAGILMLVLLFFCPLFLSLYRQQTITELAVMEVVSTCCEQWRQSGQITRNTYEEVVGRLAALGSYQLELDYSRRVLEPVWVDGEIEQVETFYLSVPWEEVKEQIYGSEECFYLYQEDQLSVAAESLGLSMAERFHRALFGKEANWRVEYGGIVVGEAHIKGRGEGKRKP